MSTISIDVMIEQLLAVLREGFEGSPNQWSYFTDGPADSALLGTLSKLSAAQASQSVGGTSIAAHVHHLRFGLAASEAWIRGDKTSRDWTESWRVKTVDDAAWTRLQQDLRDGHQSMSRAIQSYAASSLESAGGAIGIIAHVAYHLGAIRQKAALVG
jgi:hypothetical protein